MLFRSLTSKKLRHVLDQDPIVLPNCLTTEQRAAFEKWMDEDSQVKCYVLEFMSNELQSQHEYMPTARAMITYLQELYGEQSRTVRFEVSKRLFNLKIRKGQSVHEHCITVIKNIKELKKLGLDMQKKLQMNLILQSFTSSYSQFIVNFHIYKLDCTIPEFVNMLVTTEGTLKSSRGTILTVK